MITRLIIGPLIAIGFIYFGLRLIPDSFGLGMSIDDISDLSMWAIVGVFLVCTGAYNLLKLAIFAIRSRQPSGHWHFRLTADDLLWDVPKHAHGKETGFHAKLPDIEQIEFRTLERDEQQDLRSYWVHFSDGSPAIELKGYSGVSLSWMTQKIAQAGVPYVETRDTY
ncbi:hypothetical protein [Loktanella sp. S4079]|uniref:hypothetical protein n=1 Tax=Loktanella sp. S4079 TaxID=579483 RepID=UPI0005FA5996|nr:hypothetical protein [Loktanella sp. S4079]KJZ19219.1 hypothetical protein TW80_10500 [Loktanella sp. S4079]